MALPVLPLYPLRLFKQACQDNEIFSFAQKKSINCIGCWLGQNPSWRQSLQHSAVQLCLDLILMKCIIMLARTLSLFLLNDNSLEFEKTHFPCG